MDLWALESTPRELWALESTPRELWALVSTPRELWSMPNKGCKVGGGSQLLSPSLKTNLVKIYVFFGNIYDRFVSFLQVLLLLWNLTLYCTMRYNTKV